MLSFGSGGCVVVKVRVRFPSSNLDIRNRVSSASRSRFYSDVDPQNHPTQQAYNYILRANVQTIAYTHVLILRTNLHYGLYILIFILVATSCTFNGCG